MFFADFCARQAAAPAAAAAAVDGWMDGWMRILEEKEKNSSNFFVVVLIQLSFSIISAPVYFSYSASSVLGNEHSETSIYLDNITRILDRLLDGYDNRLRPGFGGRLMTEPHCASHDGDWIDSPGAKSKFGSSSCLCSFSFSLFVFSAAPFK